MTGVRTVALLMLLIGLSGLSWGLVEAVRPSANTPETRTEAHIELGQRSVGAPFDHVVDFVAPVDDVIRTIATSCGCTVIAMELPRAVVAGEKVPITLKIHTPKPADDFRVLVQLRMQSGAKHNFTLHGKIVPKPQQ